MKYFITTEIIGKKFYDFDDWVKLIKKRHNWDTLTINETYYNSLIRKICLNSLKRETQLLIKKGNTHHFNRNN